MRGERAEPSAHARALVRAGDAAACASGSAITAGLIAFEVALWLLPGAVFAGPPYATDDPVPTDRGHWETYAFVGGAHASGSTGGAFGVDLNYGAAEDLQLTMVIPAAWEHAERTRLGAGAIELAAKARLVRQADGALADIAFFPRVFLPTAGKDFGTGHASVLLPIWIGRELGEWSAFGGAGYLVNPGRGNRDAWSWGGALTHALHEGLTVGAEIYGHGADADDARSFAGVNVGVAWQMRPHWALLASGGPGLVHASSEARYAFYLALQFTR